MNLLFLCLIREVGSMVLSLRFISDCRGVRDSCSFREGVMRKLALGVFWFFGLVVC